MGDKKCHRRLMAVVLELQISRLRLLRIHFPKSSSRLRIRLEHEQRPGHAVCHRLVCGKGNSLAILKSMTSPSPQWGVEKLASDMASALCARHQCRIVHDHVKLDNVLVLTSCDRPVKALTKLTGFGHALVLNDRSSRHDDVVLRYRGTSSQALETPLIDCSTSLPATCGTGLLWW